MTNAPAPRADSKRQPANTDGALERGAYIMARNIRLIDRKSTHSELTREDASILCDLLKTLAAIAPVIKQSRQQRLQQEMGKKSKSDIKQELLELEAEEVPEELEEPEDEEPTT